MLLKDVIKARKLNNATSIDIDLKRDPKEIRINNKTSSTRQTSLLGQSSLPPYKTRQRNSSTAVTNSSVTSTFSTSNLQNYLDLAKNQENGYFRISTVDQANYISALLGKSTKQNKTTPGPNEGTFANGIKFPRNNTQWANRKGLLVNETSGFPDDRITTSGNGNISSNLTKQKTSGVAFQELKLVLKSSNNKNESAERNINSDQSGKVQNFFSFADETKRPRLNSTAVNWNSSKPQLQANRTKTESTISSSSGKNSSKNNFCTAKSIRFVP